MKIDNLTDEQKEKFTKLFEEIANLSEYQKLIENSEPTAWGRPWDNCAKTRIEGIDFDTVEKMVIDYVEKNNVGIEYFKEYFNE